MDIEVNNQASQQFDAFLLKEYENIATAHFESQKQFALFFRYYTLFFSVPIVIFFYNENKNLITTQQYGFVLIFLSVVGLLFYLYAINLKHEAILYARTVNGIRNHFYKSVPPTDHKEIRTLPIETNKPSYFSPWNPVLMIMAFLNTFILGFGAYTVNIENICLLIAIPLLWFVIHIVLNYLISRKQNDSFQQK